MIMPLDAASMSPGMPTMPGTPATPGAQTGPTSPMVAPQTAAPNAFNIPPVGGRVGLPTNPGMSSVGSPVGAVPPQQAMAILQALRSGMLNRPATPGMFAQGQGGGSGIVANNPFTSVAGVARRTAPTPMLSGLFPTS